MANKYILNKSESTKSSILLFISIVFIITSQSVQLQAAPSGQDKLSGVQINIHTQPLSGVCSLAPAIIEVTNNSGDLISIKGIFSGSGTNVPAFTLQYDRSSGAVFDGLIPAGTTRFLNSNAIVNIGSFLPWSADTKAQFYITFFEQPANKNIITSATLIKSVPSTLTPSWANQPVKMTFAYHELSFSTVNGDCFAVGGD